MPGMVPFNPESAMHAAAEQRKSGSPHVASPGLDPRSLPGFPGPSLDARQLSPLYHGASLRHPPVSKASLSMPEGLSPQDQKLLASSFGGGTPHLLRQTTSPLAAPSSKAKLVKQERSLEQMESQRQASDLPPRYVPSPDQARNFPHPNSEGSKSSQRWDIPGQHRAKSPMDVSQK